MTDTTNKATVRFDWFQTEGKVTITILKRNVPPSSCLHECHGRNLCIKINEELVLSMELYDEVVSSTASVNYAPSRVELSFEKLICRHWPSLSAVPLQRLNVDEKKKPNWDELGRTAEKEEEESDDRINKFFRTIYKDASDDVKKAMIKSFTESQGTVLSTNWGDVGQKSVGISPPDGMEYKKYEG